MSEYTPRPGVPKAVRDFMRKAGNKGAMNRLAKLTPEQRAEFARAGGLAWQAKRKAQAIQSGTKDADTPPTTNAA